MKFKNVLLLVSIIIFCTSLFIFGYIFLKRSEEINKWEEQRYKNGLWLKPNNKFVENVFSVETYVGGVKSWEYDEDVIRLIFGTIKNDTSDTITIDVKGNYDSIPQVLQKNDKGFPEIASSDLLEDAIADQKNLELEVYRNLLTNELFINSIIIQ